MASEDSDDGHLAWKQKPKVIIIGAGISGIAAANTLAHSGIKDVTILEATDRIGGRIWSVDLETVNGENKAELGANWVHGIDRNPIFKLAMENNLLPPNYQCRKLGQKFMFVTDKGEPVAAKTVEEVDWTYGMLMAQVEDFHNDHLPTPVENDSVGAFLTREFDAKESHHRGPGSEMRRLVFQQRMVNESIISGCDNLHEVSLSEAGSFEELPGVHYLIHGGFERIVDILKQDIPEENILLEHPVSQVTWSQKGNANAKGYQVCVECQNGKRLYANHVIVTCSLGYLKKHSHRLFNPSLPQFKRDAISSLSIGTVNKVLLEFESGPVLPEGICRLEVVWDRTHNVKDDVRERWHKKISFFEAIHDNVVVGWLCGREAEFMETLPDGDVIKKITEVLKNALQKQNIPRVKRMVRTNWKSMPYTLGSYSFIPVGASSEDIELLAEPVMDPTDDKPVLLFAGEATHPTFYSSSHGALLSGEREAQRILNLYSH